MNKPTGNELENPELTPYQRVLVLEMQKKPELLHILKVIFSDYAKLILTEQKFITAATKRKRAKGVELAMIRLKMEAYIEEKLAMMSGIDIVGIKKQFEDIEKNQKAQTLKGAEDTITDSMVSEITKEEDQRALDSMVEFAASVDGAKE